jgi:hypothetical protein
MNNHILLAVGLCIALLLIVLLFVWRGKAHKQKRLQQLQDQLQQMAASRQLQIDRQLQLDRRMIGLDSKRQELVYVDNTEDQGILKVHVDLQKISGCRVIKERQVFVNAPAKAEDQQVRQIFLRLDFNDKNLQSLQIPFYREAEDGVFRMLELNGLASEWQQHIDNLLTIEYLAKHK